MKHAAAVDWHRRHWERRWSQPALDHWMGGRGIGPENLAALGVALSLGARTVLEIGPGCFRFARAAIAAGLQVSAVELPLPRAASFRPTGVECWHSWRAAPLPWPNSWFDLAYQKDSVTQVPSRDVGRVLDELARVARAFLWSGTLRPRFWEDGKLNGGARAEWMRAELARRFVIEKTSGMLLMRPQMVEDRGHADPQRDVRMPGGPSRGGDSGPPADRVPGDGAAGRPHLGLFRVEDIDGAR